MTESARSVPLEVLCCPVCRGDLRETGTSERALQCVACARVFPVIMGIPDLRIFSDPYIDIETDRAEARRLANLATDTDLAGLVNAYYRRPGRKTTPEQERRFAAGLLMAGARSAATLEAWQRSDGDAAPGVRLLDLGCGTGPLLLHAAGAFSDAIGVDIGVRWLVIARKRLQEAGRDAPLLCACAEALPLRDGARDVVAAESTVEVTRDPAAALREAYRVLSPGGRVWLTTPNRWSLGPDPHLGVPAGGWWPRPLLERYVRRQGALMPKRRLLSARSLTSLLRESGFENIRLGVPGLPAPMLEGRSLSLRVAGGAYERLRNVPAMRELLLAIGPLLLATGRRPRPSA